MQASGEERTRWGGHNQEESKRAQVLEGRIQVPQGHARVSGGRTQLTQGHAQVSRCA
jgi:hypothetical protein